MTPLTPEKHTSPLRFFLATNRKELPWILLNTICYGLGTLGTVGMAFYVGKVIDGLQTNPAQLHRSVVLLVIALVFHEISYRVGHVLEVMIHARIRAKVKKALFEYTSRLSFGYFADRFAGQISHQISTAANALERMEETIVNKFIDNSWMFILSSIAIISIYRPLGIILAVWVVLYIFGVRYLAKKITIHAENFAHQESNTTGALVDMYTNVATVKVYSKDFDQSRVGDQVDREYAAQVSLGKWDVLTYAFQGCSAVFLGIAVLILTARGYGHGLITIGGIVVISGITLKIIEFVYDTGHIISSFVRNRGECAQALKDIIVPPTVVDGPKSNELWDTVGVVYDKVNFSYNGQKHILSNFSLTIPAKQRLGIVGLSGAGKTTMVNLLLRFFDPQKGKIKMNKIDITSMTQESLRSHISFISQDTSLFHTTIAENIQYGSPSATREQIESAAKMAFADEFIQTLPKGYDTVVGERGVKLSGGQRQRIAIARAMLKNAPLFLLDEATSALDSDSEAKVQEALKKLMEGKTVITIAHRLSTLQFMDRIILIEEGKVIEDGTHQELLAKNGQYAKLWSMQAGGFLPTDIN
jgi:ATP-binding cassette subfamily B protein